MTEWREARLRDICTGIFDCPHSTPALTESGPYVVRTQDIRSGTFRTDEAAHVSEATYQERIARAEPSPGDILFSREGTYFGVAAEVRHGIRVCLGQRMVLIRPDPSVADARFVRHWLNSPAMAAHIRGHRDGSVAERLNLPTIRDLPIALPPLSVQRKIASILGALDDKIELNRRTAATLEGLTRAAYAELQATCRDECSLGSIADVAVNPRDQVDPRHVEPSTPYIGLEHVPRGRMVLADWGQAASAESGKMAFRRNDILFGKLRPYFRKVGVAPSAGICSTDIIVIRPGRVEDLGYVLAVATDAAFIDASNAASTGTRMPRTSWTDLARYPLPIPPPSARAAFTKRVWPLIERAQAAVFETKTLGQVRDTLLSRLLSGDVEVAA